MQMQFTSVPSRRGVSARTLIVMSTFFLWAIFTMLIVTPTSASAQMIGSKVPCPVGAIQVGCEYNAPAKVVDAQADRRISIKLAKPSVSDETMKMAKLTHKQMCEIEMNLIMDMIAENIEDAKNVKGGPVARDESLKLLKTRLKRLGKLLNQISLKSPDCVNR